MSDTADRMQAATRQVAEESAEDFAVESGLGLILAAQLAGGMNSFDALRVGYHLGSSAEGVLDNIATICEMTGSHTAAIDKLEAIEEEIRKTGRRV